MKFTLVDSTPTTPVEELVTSEWVHQLIEQDAKGKHPWIVRAKCGYERERMAGDPLWSDFSGWHGFVTCPECLSASPRGAQ